MRPYLTTIARVLPTVEQLLAVPPGFQRFAWHGMPLLLPEDWNLQAHRGDAREGALFFVDLRATRLEFRWRTPAGVIPGLAGEWAARVLHWRKDPRKTLERQIAKLKKQPGSRVRLSGDVTYVETAAVEGRKKSVAGTSALFVAMGKIIELFWPAVEGEERGRGHRDDCHVEQIAEDSLAWCKRLEASGAEASRGSSKGVEQFWSVYGAEGFVPAGMSERRITMLPGNTQLHFARGRRQLILASSSMADRWLANKTLEAWASETIELIKKHGGGTWKQDGEEWLCTVFLPSPLRIVAPREVQFRFRHNTIANRIQWRQEQ